MMLAHLCFFGISIAVFSFWQTRSRLPSHVRLLAWFCFPEFIHILCAEHGDAMIAFIKIFSLQVELLFWAFKIKSCQCGHTEHTYLIKLIIKQIKITLLKRFFLLTKNSKRERLFGSELESSFVRYVQVEPVGKI